MGEWERIPTLTRFTAFSAVSSVFVSFCQGPPGQATLTSGAEGDDVEGGCRSGGLQLLNQTLADRLDLAAWVWRGNIS